eukprot:1818179-Alexandrium_andersonii.AAC.1
MFNVPPLPAQKDSGSRALSRVPVERVREAGAAVVTVVRQPASSIFTVPPLPARIAEVEPRPVGAEENAH